jgi:hypothetical protein
MPIVNASKVKARKKPPTAVAPRPVVAPKATAPVAAKPVTKPAAPAPVRPVFGQAPHSQQGNIIRNDAQSAMAGAGSNWHDAVFRSVMGLGDPTLLNKYKSDPSFAGYNFVADPTSTFGQLDTQQQRGMQDIMGNAIRGNTAMSGLRLNDENALATDILTQKADAGRSFEDALANYSAALAAAQQDYNTQGYNADQADIDTWSQLHPVAAAPKAAPKPTGPTAAQKLAAQKAAAQKAAALATAKHQAEVAAAKKKAKKK